MGTVSMGRSEWRHFRGRFMVEFEPVRMHEEKGWLRERRDSDGRRDVGDAARNVDVERAQHSSTVPAKLRTTDGVEPATDIRPATPNRISANRHRHRCCFC